MECYVIFTIFSCLPVNIQNETGIEVKIKHDRQVHSGFCEDPCEDAKVIVSLIHTGTRSLLMHLTTK